MRAKLKVTGMSCGHCRASVERALASQPGVAQATVELESGSAEVDFDEELIPVDRLVAAVEAEGYSATVASA